MEQCAAPRQSPPSSRKRLLKTSDETSLQNYREQYLLICQQFADQKIKSTNDRSNFLILQRLLISSYIFCSEDSEQQNINFEDSAAYSAVEDIIQKLSDPIYDLARQSDNVTQAQANMAASQLEYAENQLKSTVAELASAADTQGILDKINAELKQIKIDSDALLERKLADQRFWLELIHELFMEPPPSDVF